MPIGFLNATDVSDSKQSQRNVEKEANLLGIGLSSLEQVYVRRGQQRGGSSRRSADARSLKQRKGGEKPSVGLSLEKISQGSAWWLHAQISHILG